jgi:hypothetical protein
MGGLLFPFIYFQFSEALVLSMVKGYQIGRSSAQSPCESVEGEREKLKRLVDIRPVKELARRLPVRSRLRELILLEEDFIPAWLYVCYVGVWQRLLSLEARGD